MAGDARKAYASGLGPPIAAIIGRVGWGHGINHDGAGGVEAGGAAADHAAAQREALLRAYEQSGLTQQAFARREGIKYPTLVSWLRRRGPRRPPGAAFAEVTLPAAAGLEVRLPDGVVIRGAKLEEVAQLLRLLRC